jgi:hypothetical protein
MERAFYSDKAKVKIAWITCGTIPNAGAEKAINNIIDAIRTKATSDDIIGEIILGDPRAPKYARECCNLYL